MSRVGESARTIVARATICYLARMADLYVWWARRMLEGDYEASLAMFRYGAVVWS